MSGGCMEVFEIIGLFLAFGIIFLIDKPKLEATANKKKYSAVYYSTLAVGLLASILKVLNVIPELNDMLIDLYKKLGGQ
jgi:hypothetical protein